MPFQTKALLISIIVATNVGGYLLYLNSREPAAEAVAEQTDVPELAEPVAQAPSSTPVERPATEGMAAAAETAREAGLRASAEGRYDEAVARFREAIELGSTDESLVERLVAAQRARAATQAPQQAQAQREAVPRAAPRAPGWERPASERGRRTRIADIEPDPVVEVVEATPPPEPEPEPEPEPMVEPPVDGPGNEMERNPYLRGGG